jgi:hypothetical protein
VRKLENDPNLKEQKQILDHHPHHGMAPHGQVRKIKTHMAGKVHQPKSEKKEW